MEGFDAMRIFLTTVLRRHGKTPEEIAFVLGGSTWADGTPADPEVWEDWLMAVRACRAARGDAIGRLSRSQCNNRSRTMPKAIRIHQTGGPEVPTWEDVTVGKPGPGEARVRQTAVGVNFVDIYVRRGLYPVTLPSGLGTEAAGMVKEVGPGVSDVRAGDRVAYAGGPLGAYAEERVMPADRLVVLPEGISDQQAAAMMLKGLTTQYLIRQIHRVGPGETILFHAAAGGVGLIACQWAKSLGAIVIGTVGSDEKAKIAKAHGCDFPVVYTRDDFVGAVATITKGGKLPVVYDSVGRETFMKSLDCLWPKGLMVSFGQSSGSVGPVDLGIFAQKGSLFFTRPTLNTYAAKRADYVAMAKDLFDVVQSGKVKIEIHQTYPLKEAAQAHRDLTSRKTTGSTILTV
jgi:NADPH:quinone reductase